MKIPLPLLISLKQALRRRKPKAYGFRHFPTGPLGLPHASKMVLLGAALGLALHPVSASTGADLSVTKIAPDRTTVGSAFTYEIVVRNVSGISPTGIIVTDILPSEITFASASTHRTRARRAHCGRSAD
jgi:uncharacterized repeat protein (TIGR01451 family)